MSFSTSTWQAFLRVFFSTAHVCTCTQRDDTFQQEEYQSTSRLENADEKKFQQEEQSVQEELTPFPSSPAAFVSYLTPICHPGDSPVLCKTTQSWYRDTHTKAEISILAADSGFHFSPCAMRFIESRLHDVLLGKPRNFIIPGSSNFIVVAPLHPASSSHAADRQAYAYAPSSSSPSRASELGWLT